jgi:hypothetical protein
MLKIGAIMLALWSGINVLLASLILTLMIFFKSNAPILGMVLKKSEIAQLDPRVIVSLNALAILYNSCAAAVSILALFVIWSGLINGQGWAFWVLLISLGFVELLAFLAWAPIGNARWQVNGMLSILYLVGMVLVGYSMYGNR